MVNPKKAPSGASRITIMLDRDTESTIRDLQAQEIIKTKKRSAIGEK